ncbi:hypothetical protein VOLCADRAFT_103930 [Volvox carteri f. nagariensis]|uniref:GDP-Man:Man(3)GlcNAc(2)-PP-Dol alpha-1,2-mannosyltransferase n=1 Tax=Volvox carteri f. nagariensis TaxID=3068 RepID=D8TQ52_VOLCA|nr:uncharacterized protein VOLCADRAFT_103930 [Volvox carteri f. nagariensis]EFJ50473.1 hypothetical protein VOLCADRAFT_103930 [Volvox carteri f. nagariensis]|eukprot:XP_002948598.1 hypothetical protein VOLCADRAFT_103930 [Volvox carteri f. nagariensis]
MDSLFLILLAALCALVLGTACATITFYVLASGLPRVQKGVVAFFHPFADGGGGGERVLCSILAPPGTTQPCVPRTAQVAIFVREGVTAERLLQDAQSRFNIRIEKPIRVIPLRRTHLVKPERYPRFTLLRQALGSVALGLEALRQLVPEVYIDTTGWAFPYPFAWKAGSRVVAYVHYPTISSDMLGRVWSGTATYNNDADIAESPVKTTIKLLYYRVVALWYGVCGCVTAVTCVNSSWTRDHIQRIWFLGRAPLLVYPPVDTRELLQLPLDRKLKQLYLVSVNQFRPEKNHRLQLEAFALAKRMAGPTLQGQAVREAKLKFIGGCRNADDEARLAALQQYAHELGLADCVEWIVNASFSELKSQLGGAVGGLHTMVDEHFGISVVEYMAAGVVPIAHNSAGPKQDIVKPVQGDDGCEQVTGFLSTSAEEYSEAITRVLTMDQRERMKIAAAAQKQAMAFSTERFLHDFTAVVAPVLPR